MTRTRAWTAGVAAGCLLLVLAAWFLAISPKRAEAADLRAQAVAQQASNDQTRLTTQQLKAQYAELPARQAELKVIARQMPASTQLASVVRTLTSMAASAGVSLRSVTPMPPAAPTAPVAGQGAAPVVTPMTTTLVVAGDYASVTLFLQKLQAATPSPRATTMERAFLVRGVNVMPDAGVGGAAVTAGRVQMTVTGQFFVMGATSVPTVTIPSAS